jgi:hypothetical protein
LKESFAKRKKSMTEQPWVPTTPKAAALMISLPTPHIWLRSIADDYPCKSLAAKGNESLPPKQPAAT